MRSLDAAVTTKLAKTSSVKIGLATTNPVDPSDLSRAYQAVRTQSLLLCEPLTTEDMNLQAVAETSPPKWHLAHTTWFFETFILRPLVADYRPYHPQFEVLFNSYYNGIGEQHPRHQRGLLSRPSVEEVLSYRAYIDKQIETLLRNTDHPDWLNIQQRIVLGLHHEQQHQELLLTDIKYSFFQNPLYPRYSEAPLANSDDPGGLGWHDFAGGTVTIGYQGEGFCFDNEQPAHPVILPGFQLSDRLISNGEYLRFIEQGGYQQPEWWLADGWAECQKDGWQHPLYWVKQQGKWFEFTLHGLQPLDLHSPVSHLSGYEADAYARWAGARLPTEFELEHALNRQPLTGQFATTGLYHPRPAQPGNFSGSLWQWTSSAYGPYPNYQPAAGAIGEYNGKFMANQLVLKGGSCVTPTGHIRASYRNFFYPPDRWQFTGLRLARGQQHNKS